MSDNKSARDRIAKLLNMSEENGCTEDEAETALRMAAAIAAREGIDLNECRPKDVKVHIVFKRNVEKWKPHQAICVRAAALLFGVDSDIYNLGHEGYAFTGREDLIAMAEDTMFWLFRQVEELYKQALPPGLTKRERSEYRKTFNALCASGSVCRN